VRSRRFRRCNSIKVLSMIVAATLTCGGDEQQQKPDREGGLGLSVSTKQKPDHQEGLDY